MNDTPLLCRIGFHSFEKLQMDWQTRKQATRPIPNSTRTVSTYIATRDLLCTECGKRSVEYLGGWESLDKEEE